MTLWKQGASAVPVLARLRIIFGSAGIGIGRACCPIGTALVTEFAPRRIRATMIVMGVVGVALGGGLAGLVAAIHVDLWLARARPTSPRRRCPEQTEPLAPRCACQPTSPIANCGANDGEAAAAPRRPTRYGKRCATGSKNDPGKNENRGMPPVSKESSPCFLVSIR